VVVPEPANKPNWVLFLLIALVVMAACLGGLGGWLFPRLGFEGPLSRAVAAGVGGAIIGLLYVRIIKGPGRA
jgi:hypothetical protein